MNAGKPEADTRVEMLEPGDTFYRLGQWHTLDHLRCRMGKPRGSTQVVAGLYVVTTDDRIFTMPIGWLLAVQLHEGERGEPFLTGLVAA